MRDGAGVGETIIGRLKLRGADLEPLSAKLRLESLLSGAHLAPLGLPPSATVCIRRLADPRPGMLPVRQLTVRPPPAWEEALVQALRAQVASAARPARGAVPAGAEAVLFLDRAELLACLASDVCRGTASLNWWWRGLFPAADLARRVVAEWLRRPEYVPAALIHVARRQETPLVAALFSEDEARVLLARVCEVHGLTALSSAMNERLREDRASVADSTFAHGHPAPGPAARVVSPWDTWVPEVKTLGASLAHQAWVGISLMVQRAPATVRLTPFVEAVQAWLHPSRPSHEVARTEADPPPESQAFEAVPKVSTPRDPSASRADSTLNASPSVTEARGREADTSMPTLAEPASADLLVQDEDGLPPPAAAPRVSDSLGAPALTPPSPEGSIAAAVLTPTEEALTANTAPTPTEQPQAAVPSAMHPSTTEHFEPPSARAWGLPISTGLGGLFYLVNLGLFLELYGDFSQPRFQGLSLSVWDFVTLVGKRLLNDTRPNDPVWSVLAQLAGRRPGEAPGQGFEPPEAWHIPPAWLRAFGAPDGRPWTWSITGGRMRARHPQGFLVLDVPALVDDAAESRLRHELAPYGFTDIASLELGAVPGPDASTPLERWLAWLVPYVRARLERALGLAPGDGSALERIVFAQDARIHLTATHVDVVLSLALLPLEVRVAGLDRDVGWLPAAGRHLTFHFD
ncbi:hypothetical protein JGU66_25325 [Myxococcaceae bacterium JPH2]|nr:hypothetical protein [Myxococcaceae bacterium JPH2]